MVLKARISLGADLEALSSGQDYRIDPKLYREIRVPNSLTDAHGQKVKLQEGAEVEVKIEADPVVTKTASQQGQGNRSSA